MRMQSFGVGLVKALIAFTALTFKNSRFRTELVTLCEECILLGCCGMLDCLR
jgi:hypothetical protein